MNYDVLISFIAASAVLAISPGPDNIYVLLQSMTNGKLFGISTVFGLVSGCLVHTTLVAFGVSALIKANDNLFFVLKLLGSFYLFYLAYKVFKSSSKLDIDDRSVPRKGYWQLFKQGFIMNVLNPKVSIFFLAFFPGFLFSDTISTVIQFYVLGLIFMAVSFIIFSGIAILSGTISQYSRTHSGIGQLFKWLQIIVFVEIGIFILLSEK